MSDLLERIDVRLGNNPNCTCGGCELLLDCRAEIERLEQQLAAKERELSENIGQLKSVPIHALPDNYCGACDLEGCPNGAVWRTETCDMHRIRD